MGRKWLRKFRCGICGGVVVYDAVDKTVTCRCTQHKMKKAMAPSVLDTCYEEVPQ